MDQAQMLDKATQNAHYDADIRLYHKESKMPLMMKVHCEKVIEHGGGAWFPLCQGVKYAESWPLPADSYGSNTIYGHGTGECEECDRLSESDGLVDVRMVHIPGKSQEEITLRAVIGSSKDDPNRKWSVATPSGLIEVTIDNPEAWGFYEAGEEYMVKFTKHQPQKGS